MTQFNAPAFDIERPTGQCSFTGRKLNVGEHYMATLVETDPTTESADTKAGKTAGLGFRRLDVSMEAWREGHRPERIFSYWRSTVPEPSAKRRLFVDDEVLVNLFRRLSDATEPQRLAFRFVLALILMRKKLLRYEGSTNRNDASGNPQEWWRMTPKGEIDVMEVLNPQLDEAQIQAVSQQLGEILEAEL